MGSFWRGFFVVLLVVLMNYSSSAVAADDGRAVAREAYAEGTRLYDVGDYREALAAFKRAYLSYEDPAFLFNMAQCYRQLDDKQEAIRTYKSYLRRSPHPANEAEVERIISDLQAMLAQEKATQASPPTGTLPPKSKANEAEAAPTRAPESARPVEQQAVATPAAAVEHPAVEHRQERPVPVYKKWWLWTIVGVVVVGGGVALAVGLAESRGSGFNTTLGDFGPASHALVTF